jgi:hypothetical protein
LLQNVMLCNKKKKEKDNPTLKGTKMMPDILLGLFPLFIDFFFLLGLKGWFLCSWFILIWFPSTSQKVPQVSNAFPKMFPIAPHFYPVHFGWSWTFVHIQYNKDGPKESTFVLLFWQYLMFQNKIGNEPIKVAPSQKKKKKKKLWVHL